MRSGAVTIQGTSCGEECLVAFSGANLPALDNNTNYKTTINNDQTATQHKQNHKSKNMNKTNKPNKTNKNNKSKSKT
jgi:hypothetical protein